MASFKSYFDGFQILSASWWPPSFLLASCVTRTCPKVIISRLIGDDWGIANDVKMPVTRSSENSNFLT